MLDVGVVGKLLAVQDLVEARRREGLYEVLRLVGRACEAPLYGALEAFAGGGVFRHDCTFCGVLRYVKITDSEKNAGGIELVAESKNKPPN